MPTSSNFSIGDLVSTRPLGVPIIGTVIGAWGDDWLLVVAADQTRHAYQPRELTPANEEERCTYLTELLAQ